MAGKCVDDRAFWDKAHALNSPFVVAAKMRAGCPPGSQPRRDARPLNSSGWQRFKPFRQAIATAAARLTGEHRRPILRWTHPLLCPARNGRHCFAWGRRMVPVWLTGPVKTRDVLASVRYGSPQSSGWKSSEQAHPEAGDPASAISTSCRLRWRLIFPISSWSSSPQTGAEPAALLCSDSPHFASFSAPTLSVVHRDAWSEEAAPEHNVS